MSINESIVSLYKENKLEKSIAYQLLSQVKELTESSQSNKSTRLQTEFTLSATKDECLALWSYFVSILENQNNFLMTVIEQNSRHLLSLNIQEDMTFNQLIDQTRESLSDTHDSESSSDYLFINDSKVDTGIASTVCIYKGGNIQIQSNQEKTGKTKFEDWSDFFRYLMPQMQANPDLPLNQHDHLPPAHKSLLDSYNRTHIYLPEQQTLSSLLAPAIARHEASRAIESSTNSINYLELQTKACKVGNLLRKIGAKPNGLIPVICNRTEQMPIALYGIVLSGGAYVPLEPDNPAERIEGIVNDTNSEIIVTDSQTLSNATWDLSNSAIKTIVCLDHAETKKYQGIQVLGLPEINRQKSTTPKDINKPEDLCYVIFTSGSTGKPKGVMISHQNIVNTLVGVNNQYNVNSSDRILCFSSYSFDLSVWDIFGGFLAGARVFIPTKAEIKDPNRLIEIIEERSITIWDSVPTGMSQMLIPLMDKKDSRINESLRLAMLSGEFIPLNLPANIHRYFPNCKVSSLGGATEGTVWSIFYYPVDKVESHWKSIPYGYPLGNQQFYVLNEAMKPCAIGQKGMLYIAGMGVAQGYYGDEEKTKNAFVPSPWPSELGKTIYKTGDLGILNAGGFIEIVGRADYQVKVRGFRVELGEVETQLSGLSAIDQAAVIAKPDELSGNKLIAFYTSSSGEITAEEVKRQLGETLPQYMMPSQFVYLANPPVGTSGKLDRKALANWQVSRSELSQSFVAATTEEETRLAEALKGILGIDKVGVDDDFFLIGGDSLLSLQYLSAINNMGYDASPALIMEGRTIRKILELVKNSDSADVEHNQSLTAVLGPMPNKFVNRMPLNNKNHWNQSIQIKMHSLPDIQRLEQAIQKVCEAHPMLKAGIQPDNSSQTQISETSSTNLQVYDLRNTNPFTKGQKFKQYIAQLQADRTTQANGVSEAMLVVLSNRDIRFVWAVNHLVVDAHSWRIIIEDLTSAYRSPELDLPVEGAYSDYVSSVSNSYDDSEKEYLQVWNEFKKTPKLHLPKEFEVDNKEGDIQSIGIRLNQANTRKVIQATASEDGVNLHLLTLTSIMSALRNWSKHNLVTLDIISNGRDIDRSRNFSRTVGWFATHNPFKAEIDDDIKDNLKSVQSQWVSHQNICKHFVEACNRAHGDESHPLNNYQDNAVLYNFLGVFDNLPLPGGWQVLGSAGQDRAPENPRTHELEFEIMVVGGSLNIQLHYSGKQYRKRTLNNLCHMIQENLLKLAD